MRSLSRWVRLLSVPALAVLAMLIPASPASAATLSGGWAPFNRCPVSAPQMLAATGQAPDGNGSVPACLAADSPNGSIKIGNTTATTGDSNLQLGLVENASTGSFSLFTPPGGALVGAPAMVPGGLLALMCPASTPPASAICGAVQHNPRVNAVEATAESAGTPSDFNFLAGISTGQPIITLPIKLHLQNPMLGPSCYIGSDANPIVLHPENTDLSNAQFNTANFDTNGTPDPNGALQSVDVTGATQGDTSFSVPAATGCGPGGMFTAFINAKGGLPSPSGNNSVVLNDASTSLIAFADFTTGYPNGGRVFANAWDSAVLR
jgi:hypothetical protein